MLNVSDLIGVPYRDGARGPDAFDCYGLVKYLQQLRGVKIPDYQSPEDRRLVTVIFRSELRLWRKAEPAFGRVPLFRVPGMFHCGFMLNDDDFIHTWERSGGVCIERLSDWQARLVGVYEYIGE